MQPRIHCNFCLIDTRHVVRYTERFPFEERIAAQTVIQYEGIYAVLECAGCGSVTFTEKLEGGDLPPSPGLTFYPARARRRQPDWLASLAVAHSFADDPKYALFREIYDAVAHDSYRIAVLGIRTLIEHVMVEKVGDRGNFSRNLEAFLEAGFVSRAQAEVLGRVIELGHAVTHRAFGPDNAQTLQALDVVESTIKSIYVDQAALENAMGQLPPRTRSRKT